MDHTGLFALPVAERLKLTQDLWDSIARDQDALAVPGWQVEGLERRAIRYAEGRDETVEWEEVKSISGVPAPSHPG